MSIYTYINYIDFKKYNISESEFSNISIDVITLLVFELRGIKVKGNLKKTLY